MLKVKATVSCPLSITSRTVLAAGYKHVHTHRHSTVRAAEGYTKGVGWDGKPRPHVGAWVSVRTCARGCVCVEGAGLIYTEVKGCRSPTQAMSLFGDRVMGRGGRERKGVSTVPLLGASACVVFQGQGPVCHSSSVSTCYLSAGLSSQRSPGKHRPCRGSHPRPSPARRSPRWG